ncbi:hypothetical protein Gotri_027533 [Gossypium trilobum]|uniref:Uncharacterized protein n=1 Tax=Gossypium trilobum TaxID=34281 RepID=A0A7J9FR52_9ROSI|nr:hypothetical protein [Gossypium trilobum]
MMGTYDTLLLAFDMENRVDKAGSLWNMVNDSMRLWEAHITWLQRFLNVIMAQRLVSGVLELSSIFYFVVCHHSGGWHKQLFALLLTLRTHGLRFRTMQRTL